MDIQKTILFVASQLALMSALIPWATLEEAHKINPNCVLPIDYKFRQWGGACGYSWDELKEFHQNNDFSIIHTFTKIRVYTLITIILLNMCIVFRNKEQLVTALNIIVFILSIMATTMYFDEQNTTMVLPVNILKLQGPGFWTQILVGSSSLSVVITNFFNSYRKHY
jgi:hypothetical protein